MSRKDSMLALLRREQAEITRKMLALEKVPDEDTYPHGTAVRVETSEHRPLTYLLLKVVIGDKYPQSASPTQITEVRWYFTGSLPRHHTSMTSQGVQRWLTWDKLQSWLGDVGCESWEVLIAKSDVPLDDDHPAWKDVPAAKTTLTTDLR